MTELTERFRDERAYMSNQVGGKTVKDDESIKPHFQQYVMKNEEAKAKLQKRIEELKKLTDEQQEKVEV